MSRFPRCNDQILLPEVEAFLLVSLHILKEVPICDRLRSRRIALEEPKAHLSPFVIVLVSETSMFVS